MVIRLLVVDSWNKHVICCSSQFFLESFIKLLYCYLSKDVNKLRKINQDENHRDKDILKSPGDKPLLKEKLFQINLKGFTLFYQVLVVDLVVLSFFLKMRLESLISFKRLNFASSSMEEHNKEQDLKTIRQVEPPTQSKHQDRQIQ